MTAVERETLMHLDGCHFYSWVWREDGKVLLSFAERQGTDLMLHSRRGNDGDDVCDRCMALTRGAVPKPGIERELDDFPDDAKEAFVVVAGAIEQLDEEEA
jgi:hypothetical protein